MLRPFALLTLLASVLHAAPVELGKVTWGRDYEQGIAAAKDTGKPVLLLFQEVPG